MRRLTAALAAAALLLALIPSTAGAGRPLDVLFDSLVNNEVYLCGARLIEGGTTNGYEKQGASFTVTQHAKVTSVVLPLFVEDAPARIEVKIVAAKPWNGIDPGTGQGGSSFWDNLPDESTVIGRSTTAMVSVLHQPGGPPSPCGPPAQIVTATFKKPVQVFPGTVYWVVLQNPAGQTSTFRWINGVTPTTASGIGQYIVDGNGSRWLSYTGGFWRPSAMRVLGKVGK